MMRDQHQRFVVQVPDIRYPRLTQIPSSIPEFLVQESPHPRTTNGIKGMAERAKRTNVKAAGFIIAWTSLTTGMLLAKNKLTRK